MRFLFILFIFISQASLAQLEQPGRLEILMDDDEENFNVQSAGEKGIVLYRTVKNQETRTDQKYQVLLVDTTMHIAWEEYYFVNLRYIQIGYEYADNFSAKY